MCNCRMASLSALITAGAISMPLLGVTPTAFANPLTTPTIGKLVAELTGSDAVAGDDFGATVAISGTTVAVGAPSHANYAGRAYVYTNAAGGWKQLAELKGSDTAAGDGFGTSVAVSGTTVVVGADDADRAYVFTRTPTGWKQTGELKGSDTVGASMFSFGDEFGYSVALWGTTIVVGAFDHANDAGRAYVFRKTANGWTQTAELKGSDTIAGQDGLTGDSFGTSVAVSGDMVVVGAPYHAEHSGRAYLFTRAAGGWKQTAELRGADTVGFEGNFAGDQFGTSVAISGTTVVVGTGNGDRAYLFTRTPTGWKQTAELRGSYTVSGDDFGISAAVSGNTVVVGDDYQANGAGRAYLFTRTGGWKQVAELKGSDTVSGGDFGISTAVSGSTVVVGADYHGAGRAYVFEA